MTQSEEQCAFCEETDMDTLRPFAPGGGLVCFMCATSEEHHEAVEEEFYKQYAKIRAQVDADPDLLMAIGSNGVEVVRFPELQTFLDEMVITDADPLCTSCGKEAKRQDWTICVDGFHTDE